MSVPNEEIQQVTTRLEQLCPKDGARICIRFFGGGTNESCLQANRAGYLRLAVESLKAADAPFTDTNNEHTIQAGWGYLLTKDSDVQIGWFERRDDFTSPRVKLTRMDRLMWAWFGILLCVGIVFAIVGVVATINWLF